MNTLIVSTDFSASSRNALSYACEWAQEGGYEMLLLHAYQLPMVYAEEGIALMTMGDGIKDAESKMDDTALWVKLHYPGVFMRNKVVIGDIIETLKEQIISEHPACIILGTTGEFADVWAWDSVELNALTKLTVPVLAVPGHMPYSKMKRICFACDYKHVNEHTPIDTIQMFLNFTHAELHVVHVSTPDEATDTAQQAETKLRRMLEKLHPVFHTLHNSHVDEAIGHFVEEQHIDCLMVIPQKHGLWNSLFNRSHTKGLAKMNLLPVMALRER
ncbi:MAG: universal stress protein [Bacteroidota bacterium]